jgi:hypothetical protein
MWCILCGVTYSVHDISFVWPDIPCIWCIIYASWHTLYMTYYLHGLTYPVYDVLFVWRDTPCTWHIICVAWHTLYMTYYLHGLTYPVRFVSVWRRLPQRHTVAPHVRLAVELPVVHTLRGVPFQRPFTRILSLHMKTRQIYSHSESTENKINLLTFRA